MRHLALDNRRVFTNFLVVLLQASLSYMACASAWWYVLAPKRSLFFTDLVLLVDVPIRLIRFFLTGYFANACLAPWGLSAAVLTRLPGLRRMF